MNEVPPVLAGTVVAAFGLVVGSFLNVCIYRLPLKQSIVWPASRCTSCQRELSWYENVPVLAWLALRGRCRTCRSSVSPCRNFATACERSTTSIRVPDHLTTFPSSSGSATERTRNQR